MYSIKHILRSPLGIAIFITFTFASITLMFQMLILHYKIGSNFYTSEERINIKVQEKGIDIILKNDDIEKCLQSNDLDKEISDLKNMKYSFLTEMANIESKRNKMLIKLNSLKSSIDFYKSENDKLRKRHQLLKHEILSNIYKINEYEQRLKYSFDQIDTIKKLFNVSKDNITDLKENIDSACSIEDCINFKTCPMNHKLSLYIFDNEWRNSYVYQDLRIEFITNEDNLNLSCMVVLFLKDISDKIYYRKLSKFLIKYDFNQINNLILIDIGNNKETSSKKIFIDFLLKTDFVENLNQTEKQILSSNLIRSIHSSFSYLKSNFYDNLFIHFSIINNDYYFNETRLLDDFMLKNQKLYEKRKYFLSYHQAFSQFNSLKLSLIKKKLQHFSNFKFNINTNCKLDANLNDYLCDNLQTRIAILQDSKFALILPDKDSYFWSSSLTYRLIEALKCSTIPVLIDANLKLPLDDFIAWDEIVIRLPFSRINYLIPILSNINENELVTRQIKARNVYKSYFSSQLNQFKTLFTVVQNKLSLPLLPIENTLENEFLKSNISNNKQNSLLDKITPAHSEEKLNLIELEDGQDDSYFEFLGQIYQKPLSSDINYKNFTQNKYLLWNKLYFPFNSFPNTPFETTDTTELRYVNSYSQELNKLNYSILNNLNEADFDMDLNSSIKFKDYSSLKNFTYGGGDGKYFNHYLGGNYKEEQFTIVLLTYKREQILMKNLEVYLKSPYLNSIIIVWNSIDNEPSVEFRIKFNLHLSSKRIKIVKSKKNKLYNRFIPYDYIETDAILSLDDDTQLRLDEIMFGFRVWRENRDRIVGYPARYHSWDYTTNNYIYQSDTSCEYSMVLTGAAFYHRFYNYAFWYLMDERIRYKIDSVQNCEDIAFNMLVSHITRKSPLKATVKWRFLCKECESSSDILNGSNEEKSLSAKIGHYSQRTECIQYFISIYGYNPLLYSQYRADSVLYKSKIPSGKQKCFDFV